MTKLIQDESETLNLNKTYKDMDFRSLSFVPPWMVGTVAGLVASASTMIALMITHDSGLLQNIEPLRQLGMEPLLADLTEMTVVVPTVSGTVSAVSYRAILNRFLKPAIQASTVDLARESCNSLLKRTTH